MPRSSNKVAALYPQANITLSFLLAGSGLSPPAKNPRILEGGLRAKRKFTAGRGFKKMVREGLLVFLFFFNACYIHD